VVVGSSWKGTEELMGMRMRFLIGNYSKISTDLLSKKVTLELVTFCSPFRSTINKYSRNQVQRALAPGGDCL
jgi:hypothetical protein